MDDEGKVIIQQLIDWNIKIQEKLIELIEKKVISGIEANTNLTKMIGTFIDRISEAVGSGLSKIAKEKDEQGKEPE